MKFKVSSAELLKGILDVSKAIPAKPALPILSSFLFELQGGVLRITASDSELTLVTEVEVDNCEEEGRIAVSSMHLTDLLKTLPDQPVGIRTINENSIECSWTSGNSELPYFPAADYPDIKNVGEDAQSVTFPAPDLLEGINSTIYATGDDEMRPVMNGIYFDMSESSTTLVASDSHKLICYTTTAAKTEMPLSFILHKKAAAVLKGAIAKEAGEVSILFDASTVQFKFARTILVCRLIVGKYPRYRDVIPQNNSNILRIDRLQFLNTIRRISVCANKATPNVKFKFDSNVMEVTAQDLGFNIAAYEKVSCDYSGDILSIGFKSNFLADILNNMSCETIVMKFLDARRAAIIMPSEEEEESEKICGILIPVLV